MYCKRKQLIKTYSIILITLKSSLDSEPTTNPVQQLYKAFLCMCLRPPPPEINPVYGPAPMLFLTK